MKDTSFPSFTSLFSFHLITLWFMRSFTSLWIHWNPTFGNLCEMSRRNQVKISELSAQTDATLPGIRYVSDFCTTYESGLNWTFFNHTATLKGKTRATFRQPEIKGFFIINFRTERILLKLMLQVGRLRSGHECWLAGDGMFILFSSRNQVYLELELWFFSNTFQTSSPQQCSRTL